MFKMRSLSSGCVHTTVWMYDLDANETHGEKARWELHKNDTCDFEQILKASPHKTDVERH